MADSDKHATEIESSLTVLKISADTKKSSTEIEALPAVLNISGRNRHRRGLPRVKFTKPMLPLPKPERRIPPPPTINVNTFPGIMSKILLKCDEAAPNPQINKSTDQVEYLGVLCLVNTATHIRLYHIFCSTAKNLGCDYEKVGKLYEHKKDIKIKNQVSMQTICARSLYRSAQKNLTEYKWNKEGNVFQKPFESKSDEWILSSRLRELNDMEMEKLFNYIKFLNIHRQ